MRIGQSGSMQLTTDCTYVVLSGIAGVWQWWCAVRGSNTILMLAIMSVPFALVSYGYASLLGKTRTDASRPDGKRILVMWIGMPLSLAVASLVILGETAIMHASGFGADNLPFYDLRLLIGEAAACLVWAECLLLWLSRHKVRSRHYGVLTFVALYAGALLAYAISLLARRYYSVDVYLLTTSIVTTSISAAIIIFVKRDNVERSGSTVLSAPST